MESRDCKIINGFFLADVESVLVSIVFFFFFFSPFSFHYLSPKNCNVFSFLFHIYFDCVQWNVQPVRVVSEIRSEHELQTLWKDTRDGINYRKKSLFGIYSLNKFESFFFSFFFLYVQYEDRFLSKKKYSSWNKKRKETTTRRCYIDITLFTFYSDNNHSRRKYILLFFLFETHFFFFSVEKYLL